MCVAQFREYCKASRFIYENREQDVKDKNLQVKKGTYYFNSRSYYYVTDKKQLEKLAEQGNEYAKNHLDKLAEKE